MNKRILLFNVEVSGINKYMLAELRKRGWELTIIDVPFPRICRWWAIISTFRPNISQWKRKVEKKIEKLYKTDWVFLQRTKFCQKTIENLKGKFKIILEISGMFSPYLRHAPHNIPYATYNDYTSMLSYTTALRTGYSGWLPFPAQLPKWLKLEKELYENARLIFATNENARRSFINHYGINGDKVITVGYGLNFDSLPDFSKTYDGRTILFVGMDFERKGGFILLSAFDKVKKTIPSARLIIAGPNKDIYRIEEPGIEMLDCVRDRKTIEDLYKQASIFVMPSLCEPFGQVFLEAMAYKLPCIGSTIDAMQEIVEDGKTGFLVKPNDINGLAEKIIACLNDVNLLKEMGMAGYRKVKENFLWDNVGTRVNDGLEKILVDIGKN